jgi:hypothetical protein
MTTLYLASASPRRRDLLTQLGVAFETLAVEVDERWDGREPADGYTKRLALEKARAGQRVAGSAARVLGADTAVVLDGRILGKAATREDAVALGFDEGPVYRESYDYLRARGVAVERGILRDEAVAVLELYRREGGAIYNP